MAKYPTKYFFGIYKDYSENKRIAQLCLSVDDLSCEMLADPGCITFYFSSVSSAKRHAVYLSLSHNCDMIEYNWGNHQIIKIKYDELRRKKEIS